MLFRGTIAHVLASYSAAPLLTVVLGWGPPGYPIAGVWGGYLLAPVFVAVHVGWELCRLLFSLYGVGWEWTWREPATGVGLYCALFVVFLFLVKWVDGRVRGRQAPQAQSARPDDEPLISAIQEIALCTLVVLVILLLTAMLLVVSSMP